MKDAGQPEVPRSADWFAGIDTFWATWFPDPVLRGESIPGFWFGAKKASYKPLFEKLSASCVAPAQELEGEAFLRLSARWGHWDSPALARRRLKAAVFLDQASRNWLALQRGGGGLLDAGQLKQRCDVVALPLALSVVGPGGPDDGAWLLRLGCVPELCFLSLVLRHTKEPCFIRLAERMLLAVMRELVPESEAASGQGHLQLCSRFLEETRDALEAVGVEAYLEEALSGHLPQVAQVAVRPESPPRLAVLDQRCQVHGQGLSFLTPLLEPNLEQFERHALVDELRRSLGDLGLLRSDRGIVLSLSGGVDSMVTCCLLWLLQRRLPPEQRFRWCALHLCHPNREDARDEEGWVQWSCSRLGVDLLTYRLQIRRPHGSLRTGISRERYEEKSKQLRFRMYALCLSRLGVAGAALVAHHEDDADENRLAEMGKGNIIHIDGMLPSSVTQGVTVIRPLLKVRKAELLSFADLAAVCYMQDSTPKWSRRGWIRYVLDDLKLQEQPRFDELQALLSRAGAASAALGEAIDASLTSWKEDIGCGTIEVPGASFTSGDSKKGQQVVVTRFAARGVPVVALRLPSLFALAEDFHQKVQHLMENFRGIAAIWNRAIERQADGQRASAASAEGVAEEELEEEDPGSCPLQPVRVCEGPFEMGPFVLGRAVCVALNAIPEVHRLLNGQLVARKALKHVWDCVVRARREHHWGTFHKLCPFLYVTSSDFVVPGAEDVGDVR